MGSSNLIVRAAAFAWQPIFLAAILSWPLGISGQSPTLQSITVTQILDLGTPITTLGVGAVRQFTATGNYSDGSTQYLTQAVTWSSASPNIASVSSVGLVTGVAPGTVTISAASGNITGSSSLTMVAQIFTGLALTPAGSWSVQVGQTLQFAATAEFGEYENAVVQDVTAAATWTSSAPTVANVSPTGLVTAASPGSTTVSATYSTPGSTFTATTAVNVSSTPPANVGQWTRPYQLGFAAIHAAMLYTGNVLFFGYPTGRNGGPSPARLWNPETDIATDLTLPFPIDIFCGGQAFLPDGRLLVVGGLNDALKPADAGTYDTTIFDPIANAWSQGPTMNYARWYPTAVPMPDGTILVASGVNENGTYNQVVMESYNPTTNSWTALPSSANISGTPDLYPLMTVLGSGNILYSAPRPNSQTFNPSTNSWSSVAKRNSGFRFHAGVALLPNSQKVLIVGGATTNTATASPQATSEVIDFSVPNPVWTNTSPLNIARYDMNLVYLADGNLLAVGGNQSQHYQDPVEQPELYNTGTGRWTLMAPQVGTRGYHSTALLLPDGRVVSAGSDSGGSTQNSYEIYSPPYLFKGARPSITLAPASITYGQAFALRTPDAANIAGVAIIRPGATTHANHMDDQRYVDLTWTTHSGELTVTAPTSPNDAPPGYYMLVIVNSRGVPSIMPFVQLQATTSAIRLSRPQR
ncbi:MAG TPA: galactose oxidase-like domain-containing protein [Candidatus Aquilonibacter sp.]|nr:galactose oxidase-like domain-containing protein [Candidatus Aquilonibacter sp.]